jgi:RNA polymerase sigma-70 factor (ECF subfamily)
MKSLLMASVTSFFGVTDEQAMWRVQMHDDAHAFARLVERWEAPIQRLCTRMLNDQQRGEDLAQETFARLFSKRKEYKVSGRFSTFLWRMALNLCYDELRRRKRRPESPLPPEDIDDSDQNPSFVLASPGPDALLLRAEEGEMVRWAIQQLSEACRSVIILRHYEDLKFREIAEVLEIPEGTVKSRMAEALTQLHRILSNAFGDSQPVLCQTRRKPMESSSVR